MSSLSIIQMRGQSLDSVLPKLPENFGVLSDRNMEIFIPICAAAALMPAGQEQYENIMKATIHDIYPDEEDCSHVIRLDGVEAYELDQLYDHYEGHMEAERQMGMGL